MTNQIEQITSSTTTIIEHFATLEDPRTGNALEHQLMDILVIALCAMICGADSWTEIELFGNAKQAWFKTFLALKNGIPSHDTFGRVFSLLDGQQFESCFLKWVQSAYGVPSSQVIAIDGKHVRRSHDKGIGREAIHMVSAWASESHLVLGQVMVEEKSNEIVAIPQLLRTLWLQNCIVTIDAMGCHKEIAQLVVEQEGDYLLALKNNQGQMLEDVTCLFERGLSTGFQGMSHDYSRTVDKGHGRLEIRECWTITGNTTLDFLRHFADWPSLRSLVRLKSQRTSKGETEESVRYYISSWQVSATQLLSGIRHHWQIENGLHWVLDMAFREDECRVRIGYAAQNLAILRHTALNLLKQEKTVKVGIKAKRLKAGWDEAYLLKILQI